MKMAIVNSKDMFDKQKNPTLCMSLKRYTGGCIECAIFRGQLLPLKKGRLSRLPLKCKPIITAEMMQEFEKNERAKIEPLSRRVGFAAYQIMLERRLKKEISIIKGYLP